MTVRVRGWLKLARLDMQENIVEIDLEFKEPTEKEEAPIKCENVKKLKDIAFKQLNPTNVEEMENKEKAITKLANIYLKNMQDENLLFLFPILREYLNCSNKTRTARLIRVLLDLFLESNVNRTEAVFDINSILDQTMHSFCFNFLKIKLAHFLYYNNRLSEAVELGERLVRDLKKMSYKDELIEILIIMCKIYFIMGNYQKCRTFLTSVRTTANTTHLSSKLQANIDLLTGFLYFFTSGSIHCKETDYVTAYSYFYEAFEVFSFFLPLLFDKIENRNAIKALKYMLFCKIMVGRPDDVPTVLSGKLSLKYRSRELDAMKAVAIVFEKKNLNDMKDLLKEYEQELINDPVVKVHLKNLHDTLFENNLLMVIEPYSIVEISHIANLIKMNTSEVINRIARMILDNKLDATLDQGFGTLEVFPFKEDDGFYKKCIQSVQ
ncbi:hypothetical protein HZS_4507, partial [Henneguya salminicola]